MTSQALLAEAPYGVDASMQALCVKYAVADAEARRERQVELARRMLEAAEAASWPAHSVALAHLRWRLVHALELVRTSIPFQQWSLSCGDLVTTEEEDRLLGAARDTIFARMDAGTLLTLTPSESAFQDACDTAACHSTGKDGASFPRHALGYSTALCIVSELATCTTLAWGATELGAAQRAAPVTAVSSTRPMDRDVSDVARLLALVRAVRCAPPGTRNSERELVLSSRILLGDEMHLISVMSAVMRNGNKVAWFPRTMMHTQQHGTVARFREAWRDAADAYGPLLLSMADARVTSLAATAATQRAAVRQRFPARACAHCGASEPEPRLFKVCSRCAGPAYCCKEHQVAHWRAGHKAECKKRGAQGGAAAAE